MAKTEVEKNRSTITIWPAKYNFFVFNVLNFVVGIIRFKCKSVTRQLLKFKDCWNIDQHVIDFKLEKSNASRPGSL